MTDTTITTRRVARLAAFALWAIGSAYLIKTELDASAPDWVLIVATPIVWAVVIALPVLAGHSWRTQPVAAALLLAAAVVGTAYTMSGSLSRQSESRDTRIAQAERNDAARIETQRKLSEAEAMLASAQKEFAAECKSGVGKRCQGIQATLDVYESAVADRARRLDSLRSAQDPRAGERRIASAIAAVRGGKPADYEPIVGAFLPSLFGLFCELGALALAMLGWHTRRAPKQAPVVIEARQIEQSREDYELQAVRAAVSGGALTNADLAAAMGTCEAEASKRAKKAVEAGIIRRRRTGKEVVAEILN